MVIAALTFILWWHKKMTGKTLPHIEKILNSVKNSKRLEPLAAVADKQPVVLKRTSQPTFKKNYLNTWATTKIGNSKNSLTV